MDLNQKMKMGCKSCKQNFLVVEPSFIKVMNMDFLYPHISKVDFDFCHHHNENGVLCIMTNEEAIRYAIHRYVPSMKQTEGSDLSEKPYVVRCNCCNKCIMYSDVHPWIKHSDENPAVKLVFRCNCDLEKKTVIEICAAKKRFLFRDKQK